VSVNNATISSLTLNNGAMFEVAVGASFGSFDVLGGTLKGKTGQVPLGCKQIHITGPNVQTLENLTVKTGSLVLQCGTSCQLITSNVVLDTNTQPVIF